MYVGQQLIDSVAPRIRSVQAQSVAQSITMGLLTSTNVDTRGRILSGLSTDRIDYLRYSMVEWLKGEKVG